VWDKEGTCPLGPTFKSGAGRREAISLFGAKIYKKKNEVLTWKQKNISIN
jgi:hypothetical protein